MTALGFLLLFCGVLVGRVWGTSPIETLLGRYNKADYIGGALAAVGLPLLLAGVFTWLWRAMP